MFADTEFIENAIDNLKQYQIIEYESGGYFYLNLERLIYIGYVLLMNKDMPIFCKVKSLKYQNNPIPYKLNVVTYESFKSYEIIKIKDDWSSMKSK